MSEWAAVGYTPIVVTTVAVGGSALAPEILPLLTGGGTAAETACSDGDCFNEVRTGTNAVYEGFNELGQRYVGITNNLSRRFAEHSRDGITIRGIPGLDQLSRIDARAVEQVLIEHYGFNNLLNKINSISPLNPIYQIAIIEGQIILETIGYILE
jgi:hypothetical protein